MDISAFLMFHFYSNNFSVQKNMEELEESKQYEVMLII